MRQERFRIEGAAPNGGGEGNYLGESGGFKVSGAGGWVGGGDQQLGCHRWRGIQGVRVRGGERERGGKGASEVTSSQPASLLPGAPSAPPTSQLLKEEEEGGSRRRGGRGGTDFSPPPLRRVCFPL